MAPNLASVEAKIGRAKAHLVDLKERMSRVFKPDDHRFRFEENLKGGYHVLRIDGLSSVEPEWPLITGDCIHNLRSALDHLACQLVELDGRTPNDRTAFPVKLSPFDKVGVRIGAPVNPGIRRADIRDAIEECQPYNAPKGPFPTTPEAHMLWRLNSLDIRDKHRLALVVARAANVDALTWAYHPDRPRIELVMEELKNDSEVARFWFTNGQVPPDYNPRPAIRVVLNESNLGDTHFWHLPDLLGNLITFVEGEIIGNLILGQPGSTGFRRFF